MNVYTYVYVDAGSGTEIQRVIKDRPMVSFWGLRAALLSENIVLTEVCETFHVEQGAVA